MSDLKEALTSLDLTNITTYIQSGNVLFDTKSPNELNLEERIKDLIYVNFGFDVPVIIREKQEFLQLINNCPFEIDAISLKQVHVTFLSAVPQEEQVNELKSAVPENEELIFLNDNFILKCGDRYSQAKLNNGFIERKLKVTATTRNWKTILKLKELACER